MDEERQRKDEETLQNEANRIGRDKKKNKSKFTMVAKIAAMVVKVVTFLVKIAPIIIAGFVIVAISHILKLEGDNTTTGVAMEKVIQNKENVDIAEAEDGKGYYFKINKDIMDKYLEEINKAYHLRILGRP